MKSLPAAILGVLVVLVMLVAAACRPSPSSEIALGEMVVEMGDVINQVQHDNALLQSQIDSLREIVARQDTMIRRLANAAGMPLP